MKLKHNSINYSVTTVDALLTLVGEENDVVVVTDENRGGTFVYKSAEVGNDDGGTKFSGWCRQYDGAVNVKWFGAKGDGVTNDYSALSTVIDNYDNVFIPYGIYYTNTALTPRTNLTILGEGCEGYGEFDWGTSSTIYSDDTYVFFTSGNCSKVTLEKLNIQGNWTNIGILIDNIHREWSVTDVSIKNVARGLVAENLYYSQFRNFTITCRDIGMEVYAGGTTLNINGFGVQGDKTNNIRCNWGAKFTFGSLGGSMTTATFNNGFVQYSKNGIYLDSSNCISLNSFDFEDIGDGGARGTTVADANGTAVFLYNTYKAKIGISNCSFYFDSVNSAHFQVEGTSNPQTVVTIDNMSVPDSFDISANTLFLYSSAPSSVACKFLTDYTFYNYILGDARDHTKVSAGAERRISTFKPIGTNSPEGLIYTGATSYDITYYTLQKLYEDSMYLNVVDGDIDTGAPVNVAYGNGHYYRIVGIDSDTGHLSEAVLRCRTAATASGYVYNVYGDLADNITIDNANLKFILATSSSALSYTITRA